MVEGERWYLEMNPLNENLIKVAKKRAKWGCLTWAAILFLGPIIWIGGSFLYEMYFQERSFVTSESPNRIHKIKVVEKGSPFYFGPSSVKIKYDRKMISRSINNDGKRLDSTHAIIHWKNDDVAYVVLYGEEQTPETVKVMFSEDENTAEDEGLLLGTFEFKTSDSPNKVYMIQFTEATILKEPSQETLVRIYYGKPGSILEKYIDYYPSDIYTPDNFKVEWKSDTRVAIEVIGQDEEGEPYVEDSIEIDVSK